MSNFHRDLQIIQGQINNLGKKYNCLLKYIQDNGGSGTMDLNPARLITILSSATPEELTEIKTILGIP